MTDTDKDTVPSRASSVSGNNRTSSGKGRRGGRHRRDDSDGFDSRNHYAPCWGPQQQTWIPQQYGQPHNGQAMQPPPVYNGQMPPGPLYGQPNVPPYQGMPGIPPNAGYPMYPAPQVCFLDHLFETIRLTCAVQPSTVSATLPSWRQPLWILRPWHASAAKLATTLLLSRISRLWWTSWWCQHATWDSVRVWPVTRQPQSQRPKEPASYPGQL